MILWCVRTCAWIPRECLAVGDVYEGTSWVCIHGSAFKVKTLIQLNVVCQQMCSNLKGTSYQLEWDLHTSKNTHAAHRDVARNAGSSHVHVPTLTHIPTSHVTHIGLARTVYKHCIWPYIWWYSCQKYCICTVYIYCSCQSPVTHTYIHTRDAGPAVSGLIGTKLPKYSLFGDVMWVHVCGGGGWMWGGGVQVFVCVGVFEWDRCLCIMCATVCVWVG